MKIEGHDVIIRMHHEELIDCVHMEVTMASLGEYLSAVAIIVHSTMFTLVGWKELFLAENDHSFR